MRDFGFWVRMVAITQLFSLVLSNYGDGWLAHDNPILNIGPNPARVQLQVEAPVEPEPKLTRKRRQTDDETGPGTWEKQFGAGWGGFEAPEMDSVAPEQPEYVRNGSLEPDTSTWAEDGA